MEKQIAVDILTSGITGEPITTHDVIISPNQPDISLLDADALITKQNLSEALPDPSGKTSGMRASGTANPIVVPFTYGTNPKVSVVVALSTDGTNKTLTNRQVTLAYDLVFTDSTKTTLVSVNIWGNDNGGVLNEDTYYSIQG